MKYQYVFSRAGAETCPYRITLKLFVGEVIPLLGDSPNRGDATQWQRGLPSAAEQKCLRKQTKGSAELQILRALPQKKLFIYKLSEWLINRHGKHAANQSFYNRKRHVENKQCFKN